MKKKLFKFILSCLCVLPGCFFSSPALANSQPRPYLYLPSDATQSLRVNVLLAKERGAFSLYESFVRQYANTEFASVLNAIGVDPLKDLEVFGVSKVPSKDGKGYSFCIAAYHTLQKEAVLARLKALFPYLHEFKENFGSFYASKDEQFMVENGFFLRCDADHFKAVASTYQSHLLQAQSDQNYRKILVDHLLDLSFSGMPQKGSDAIMDLIYENYEGDKAFFEQAMSINVTINSIFGQVIFNVGAILTQQGLAKTITDGWKAKAETPWKILRDPQLSALKGSAEITSNEFYANYVFRFPYAFIENAVLGKKQTP